MSSKAEIAAIILPPYEGDVEVDSVTAGSASGAITFSGPSGCFWSIIIDDGSGGTVGAYLTAQKKAAPTDPAPTATSGGGRTFYFPAEQIAQMRFRGGDQIKVYPVGTGTVYVRKYPSSPIG